MHVMNIYTHFLYIPRAKSYFRNICWNLKLGSYYDTQIWFQNSNSMLDRWWKMADFKTRYLQDCSVRYSMVRRSNFHVVWYHWYPLLGLTWNSIPGEARCCVFLRNWVTYRDHLPLDMFGGWHLSISPTKAVSN